MPELADTTNPDENTMHQNPITNVINYHYSTIQNNFKGAKINAKNSLPGIGDCFSDESEDQRQNYEINECNPNESKWTIKNQKLW